MASWNDLAERWSMLGLRRQTATIVLVLIIIIGVAMWVVS